MLGKSPSLTEFDTGFSLIGLVATRARLRFTGGIRLTRTLGCMGERRHFHFALTYAGGGSGSQKHVWRGDGCPVAARRNRKAFGRGCGNEEFDETGWRQSPSVRPSRPCPGETGCPHGIGQKDLDDIWFYIAQDSGCIKPAERVIWKLHEKIVTLAASPGIGRRCDDIDPGGRCSL
jgi:hypothetical protein